MEKQTFEYQGIQYPFWTYGDVKNSPLLFIPGFTGVHRDVETVAEFLANNFFVIVPDLPGWGESPKGKVNLTIDAYVDFLHTLIETLHKKEKVSIVGHCMGSLIALEYAYAYSKEVTMVFPMSVPYPKGDMGEEVLVHLTNLSLKLPPLFRPLLYFWRSRILAIPSGFFVIQVKSLREKMKIILRNAIKQQFQDEDTVEKNWTSMEEFDYSKLKTLRTPVHIIHGKKDLLVNYHQAEKLQKLLPNATLDTIQKAGHMPPVETPKEVVKVIERLLR